MPTRKQLASFTKQLSALVKEGIPLVRALNMSVTEENDMRDIAESLNYCIMTGSTFAEAAAQNPKVFDKVYINLIRCGEHSGTLDEVLPVATRYLEMDIKWSIDMFLYKVSMMLNSGCPILQALWISEQGLSVESELKLIHDAVKEGEYFSNGMTASGLFTKEQIDRVREEEERGTSCSPASLARVLSDLISNKDIFNDKT